MVKKFRRYLPRAGYVTVVGLLLLVVSAPAFRVPSASAQQLTSRAITMSDSGASANSNVATGVGSGTNVTYRVQFTTFNVAQSVVIDFCAENPLIGDVCTTPTGMSAAAATLNTVTGETDITAAGWTITPAAGQVRVAKGTGSDAAVGSHVFELTGITNPSTIGTFFARIYTFADGTYGTYTNAQTPGNYLDYGGVAMSTVRIISITARVAEQLTFCVSGSDHSTWDTNFDCSDPDANVAPALTLGHGAPSAILDSSAVDRGNVYTQISTNALYGAVVAMRNSNACGGLSADGGTTCSIPATNGGANTGAAAMTAGTAAFGLFVSAGVASGSGGIGTLTPSSVYHDAAHTNIATGDLYYGMDTQTAVGANATLPQYGNINTTYGSILMSTTVPVYRVNSTLVFAATASLTTPAGIYTANMNLIATGTF